MFYTGIFNKHKQALFLIEIEFVELLIFVWFSKAHKKREFDDVNTELIIIHTNYMVIFTFTSCKLISLIVTQMITI